MTWQLGAFMILALALAGGFAWYERSRPDARIVALVATLAALAALGRIAFAALPNVKPTTDIVLVAGYALGGAPGFVVGAVAGLVSNFFFGQGPWTPWQMAAWGATGALGAGLAVMTRGRIGRWSLAAACTIAGFAFAAMQDVGDWVTYSDHSLAQLGVYVGKGVGFDLIHAGACLVFALLFAPWLVHSLRRFRQRIQVSWSTVVAGALVAVTLAGVAAAPARAASSPTQYLLGAQNVDGGFGAAPGMPSSALFSGWAALGLAAAGHNALDVARSGESLLAYVSAYPTGDVGSVERTILVLSAAGISTVTPVARLDHEIARDGSISDQSNLTAFAILALRAAGAPVPARTRSWLLRQQNADGGFGFGTAGGASDVDDTGAVLEALGGSSATARATAYIRSQQNSDGGFPALGGGNSNAQSTAWAVQGLLAAGAGGSATLRRANAYLTSLIAPDGHVRYSHAADQTPVWVTAQALMALEGKPLPLAPVPRAPRPRVQPTTARTATTTTATSATSTTSATRPSATAPGTPSVAVAGKRGSKRAGRVARPGPLPAQPSTAAVVKLCVTEIAQALTRVLA